jgi:hypothetical protein
MDVAVLAVGVLVLYMTGHVGLLRRMLVAVYDAVPVVVIE